MTQRAIEFNPGAKINALPISRESRWGDDQWTFDHPNRDTAPSNRRIVWNIDLADGSKLTDRKHRRLLHAAKAFTWSMRVQPPPGRKKQKFTTLMKTGDYVLVLVKWMIAEGIVAFSELTRLDITRYMAAVARRKGRGGKTIDKYTIGCFAQVVEDLYWQRELVPDLIEVVPFDIGDGAAALMRGRTVQSTKVIPDAAATALYESAEKWLAAGAVLIEFNDRFQKRLETIKKAHPFHGIKAERARRNKQCALAWADVLRYKPVEGLPPGCPDLSSRAGLAAAIQYLLVAGYIVIAMMTGMRVSEQLSMSRGCVRRVRHKRSQRTFTYVKSHEHKIRGSDEGVPMTWVAPPVVVSAVKTLEASTKWHRRVTGFEELFLTRHGIAGRVGSLEKRDVDRYLRRFAEAVDVAGKSGVSWAFKTHQFRKAFARFVARRDHTGLLALSTQLKHVTRAMTDESYVGNDHALRDLISEELESVVFEAVQGITSGQHLAGKMGERIERRLAFLGRAGTQIRKDYAKFILEESSLIVIPDLFGDCIFAPETALCGGEDERRGLGTCIQCSNCVIRQDHRPFWEDYVRRCDSLLRSAWSPLAAAPIIDRRNRALAILRQLDGDHGK